MKPLDLHARKNLTPSQRQKMFDDHKGVCVICNFGIDHTERWRDEHIRPLALGGSNDLSNRGPAHERCSKAKDKTDIRSIAKAKRQRSKHLGIKRTSRPMPGSKASGFRKRMDGTVERR